MGVTVGQEAGGEAGRSSQGCHTGDSDLHCQRVGGAGQAWRRGRGGPEPRHLGGESRLTTGTPQPSVLHVFEG